jgi:hypothetical protein
MNVILVKFFVLLFSLVALSTAQAENSAQAGRRIPICESVAFPVVLDPNAERFSPTHAYWTMWFSYALEQELPEIQRRLAEAGVEDYRVVERKGLGLQSLVARIAGQVVVVFRGTRDAQDFIDDATFGPVSGAKLGLPGKIHSGFLNNFSRVWEETRNNALALGAAERGVWLVGHSLGGSLASLAALKFDAENVNVHAVYAFAQPNPGNAEFASIYNARLGDRTFIVQHGLDITPHLPPVGEVAEAFAEATPKALEGYMARLTANMGYRHIGRAWKVNTQGVMKFLEDRVEDDRSFFGSIRFENNNRTLPGVLSFNADYTAHHDSAYYHCAMKAFLFSAQ